MLFQVKSNYRAFMGAKLRSFFELCKYFPVFLSDRGGEKASGKASTMGKDIKP